MRKISKVIQKKLNMCSSQTKVPDEICLLIASITEQVCTVATDMFKKEASRKSPKLTEEQIAQGDQDIGKVGAHSDTY